MATTIECASVPGCSLRGAVRSVSCSVVRRLILALAAVATVMVLRPSASDAARLQDLTSPASRCKTSQLAVSLSRVGVGAGNLDVSVYLRNRSTVARFLFGYAGFGLENDLHHSQRSRVYWGSTYFQADPGPHRVVLRPNARAVTNLAWTDNPWPGERQKGNCEPPSAWLEVTPPDERRHLLVRFGASVCGHGQLASTALSRAMSR